MTISAPPARAARPGPPIRGSEARRLARRRAQRRGRILLAVILLATVTTITLTDLNGRAEVGQNRHLLAVATHHLASTRATLFDTQDQTQSAVRELESIQESTLNSSDSLTDANNSIAADNLGSFFDGISVSTLDDCLVGVVQSLDQIAVGQVAKAIFDLNAITPICNAVPS